MVYNIGLHRRIKLSRQVIIKNLIAKTILTLFKTIPLTVNNYFIACIFINAVHVGEPSYVSQPYFNLQI